jgi:hypothetical protein
MASASRIHGEKIEGSALVAIRYIRVGRIFRLFSKLKNLQILFKATIDSFISMFNIGLLLILIVYIFAIIGMNLFADMKQDPSLSDRNNFATFPNSLQAMFRMSTGEAWEDIV